MKKLLTLLILLILPFSLLYAADNHYGDPFAEEQNYLTSYFDFTMGYGYTRMVSDSATMEQNGIDFGFGFGFVDMNPRINMGFGMGIRFDALANFWNDEGSTFNTMIGPKFLFELNDYMNLSLLVGPAFNAVGKNNTGILSIAPACDITLEFYPSKSSAVSFKVGTALYGQIGIGEKTFGLSAVPYLTMTVRGDGLLLMLFPLLWFMD